ncbi:MAG: hypothetical protein A2Y17_06105 [Clostridiales bacterium GWF2_38_85]|nr:MAG: hypothetical protein A2Y17_06105 [Clostridiales bacterium GWF2_38_85]
MFSEVKCFQVNPTKIDEFEEIIKEMRKEQAKQAGCVKISYMKRFYTLEDLQPRKLTKIVKCVKYFSYWEFDCIDNYSIAVKWFFETYLKPIQKLLIMPFDVYSGETIDSI